MEERFADTQKRIISYDAKADNSVLFRRVCPISTLEELAVICLFLLVMGGPMALIGSFFTLLLFGTWTQLAIHAIVTAFLALHPLPSSPRHVFHPVSLWLSKAAFKYFSYRFMWTGDALQATLYAPHTARRNHTYVCVCNVQVVRQGDAWIGAAAPHGALPIANLLCMPSVNLQLREFVGAPASVVFRTPFLRYLLILGACDVSGKSMLKQTQAGACVGMVPDGVAGIFQWNPNTELVALKSRKVDLPPPRPPE